MTFITILKHEDTDTIDYLNQTFDIKLTNKRVNQSKHPQYDSKDFVSYFTPGTIQLIQTTLADEFDYLGYSIDING